MKKEVKLLATLIIVAGLVGVGTWFVQQNKVNKLETRVSELEKQLSEATKSNNLTSVMDDLDESSPKARDIERQTDIRAIHGQIETYYALNGWYPTLANINDTDWRLENMYGLETEALRDPQGEAPILVKNPSKNLYAYDVSSSDKSECNNSTKECILYTLTATLENGQTFTKQNLIN